MKSNRRLVDELTGARDPKVELINCDLGGAIRVVDGNGGPLISPGLAGCGARWASPEQEEAAEWAGGFGNKYGGHWCTFAGLSLRRVYTRG